MMDTLPTPPMRQEAPYPVALAELVDRLAYRPGWTFKLAHIDRGQGSEGLTLIITTKGYDSYHPERGEGYRVNHYMPVPPAAFDPATWQRWLFDQLGEVERHECMEFFALIDPTDTGPALRRPYAPNHGPGRNPYVVHEYASDEARRTRFTGEVESG